MGNNNKFEDMENSEFHKFFIEEIKDIYGAELSLVEALPRMQEASTCEELSTAFSKHAEETQQHVETLESIFDILGEASDSKKCEAMEGLIKEAESIIADTDRDSYTRDAALILAAQKVEHYEIATYGTLRTFARIMSHIEIADLLEKTLDNEKTTNEALTEIAESFINSRAATE
ncbi:ferritin-like domain-containing protein [Niabella ginsengisoli]|uniref:Ferritin-like domain-containing protein n=1 Tax=Niabella ginsengisoli TaxID=522298 RepID=A0ABS9SKE5_9BACT|nr:ferritin-like domain-containing protein [Niabella ginsengisoli]MCH5598852.1 ferritin-like domain-containing protein [Niabella ginsengisoli]